MKTTQRLGTRLRALIDRLDGDVQAAYAAAGLDYRPRYTPIVRALIDLGPSSIREIADHAGMTHSAVSQTVDVMRRGRLLRRVSGPDARESRLAASSDLEAIIPLLSDFWRATNSAAEALDAELEVSLARAIDAAHDALDQRSFAERIAMAANAQKGPS